MPAESHHTTVILPPDLRRRVYFYQASHGLSLGAVVRTALEALLAAPPAPPRRSATPAKRRAGAR